jgi:hypothetical protein
VKKPINLLVVAIVPIVAVVAVVAVYAYGLLSLSESGANRFLDELEALSLQGKGREYCARLHPDLRVSVHDHSADPPADFDGGREDFCAYVSYAAKGMGLLGISTRVARNDFTITRSWLHPWTAQVRYHEDRVTVMTKVDATLHTRSDDSLTLVQTFGGIRLLSLDSRVTLAP